MMYAARLCVLIAMLSPAVAFAQNARDSAGVRIIDNKAPALGRQRDELGVERVVVYPLERR